MIFDFLQYPNQPSRKNQIQNKLVDKRLFGILVRLNGLVVRLSGVVFRLRGFVVRLSGVVVRLSGVEALFNYPFFRLELFLWLDEFLHSANDFNPSQSPLIIASFFALLHPFSLFSKEIASFTS